MGALVLKGVWRRDTEEMEELAGAGKQREGGEFSFAVMFLPTSTGWDQEEAV